jgi:sugar phosphate isomerase/epimerase
VEKSRADITVVLCWGGLVVREEREKKSADFQRRYIDHVGHFGAKVTVLRQQGDWEQMKSLGWQLANREAANQIKVWQQSADVAGVDLRFEFCSEKRVMDRCRQ